MSKVVGPVWGGGLFFRRKGSGTPFSAKRKENNDIYGCFGHFGVGKVPKCPQK
jgi:hypothetical protein